MKSRQLGCYFRFIRFEEKRFFFFEKLKNSMLILFHSTTNGRLKKNHDILLKSQWRWYQIFFWVWNKKASLDSWCLFFENGAILSVITTSIFWSFYFREFNSTYFWGHVIFLSIKWVFFTNSLKRIRIKDTFLCKMVQISHSFWKKCE